MSWAGYAQAADCPVLRLTCRRVAARLAAAYPATNRNWSVLLKPLCEQLVGTLRPAILSLLGSVVLVLLIACANVANPLMVRATAKWREIAVRQALGADRIQLFSQFLAQTLALCLLGGALGILLAAGALPLLRLAFSHAAGLGQSTIESISLSIPVLFFTLGIYTLSAVLFGLLPVIKNPASLTETLRPGDRGSTGGHSRSRGQERWLQRKSPLRLWCCFSARWLFGVFKGCSPLILVSAQTIFSVSKSPFLNRGMATIVPRPTASSSSFSIRSCNPPEFFLPPPQAFFRSNLPR